MLFERSACIWHLKKIRDLQLQHCKSSKPHALELVQADHMNIKEMGLHRPNINMTDEAFSEDRYYSPTDFKDLNNLLQTVHLENHYVT